MKKIKLLTPIITAGVLSAAIPTALVSCNKNNEEDNVIWLDQWDESWNSLKSKKITLTKGGKYTVKIRWSDALEHEFKDDDQAYALYCGWGVVLWCNINQPNTVMYVDDEPIDEEQSDPGNMAIVSPRLSLDLNENSIIKVVFTLEKEQAPDWEPNNGYMFLKKYK